MKPRPRQRRHPPVALALSTPMVGFYLNETTRRYDAAVMDAFSSEAVPAHLVTQETFARLREIVDGPIYVNLIDTPDGPLVRGTYAILDALYPHVIAVQGPTGPNGRGNVMLAAASNPPAGNRRFATRLPKWPKSLLRPKGHPSSRVYG